jgi:hypothetical protein
MMRYHAAHHLCGAAHHSAVATQIVAQLLALSPSTPAEVEWRTSTPVAASYAVACGPHDGV